MTRGQVWQYRSTWPGREQLITVMGQGPASPTVTSSEVSKILLKPRYGKSGELLSFSHADPGEKNHYSYEAPEHPSFQTG